MKYVMFIKRLPEEGMAIMMPVIIPDHVTHSQVKLEDAELISAGFFDVKQGKAYGRSESLNLDSREEDSRLVSAALLNIGVYAFMMY
jgi:hypothetical protein